MLTHNKYLFVFPHPDDEVYCCALMNRLLSDGKDVHAILITNGNAGGDSAERGQEMKNSLELIGLDNNQMKFLQIPELDIMNHFVQIEEQLTNYCQANSIEALVSVDYEGGHEGHDSTNFLAHFVNRKLRSSHYVYPIYNIKEGKRRTFHFVSDSEADTQIDLTEEEKDLKIKVIECHRSQIGHFLGLQKAQDDYFKNLFEKEMYCEMREVDYLQRPEYDLGYENHRNGFKFEDFVNAVKSVSK